MKVSPYAPTEPSFLGAGLPEPGAPLTHRPRGRTVLTPECEHRCVLDPIRAVVRSGGAGVAFPARVRGTTLGAHDPLGIDRQR